MPQMENDAARLRSLSYLLNEALRIADEGHRFLIGVRISECIDQVERELSDVTRCLAIRETS